MKKQAIKDVTPEVIEGWKAEYGQDNIMCIEVADESVSLDPHILVAELDDQPRAVGYLRKPDNKVLSYATQQLPRMLDAGKVILKNCWLGGDDRILSDDSYANSAAMQVIELINIRQGRLKKV